MFEKFGNMNYSELMKCAEGLKKEGDKESLILLCEENGLEKDDALDYLDFDEGEVLATPAMAAYAKVQIEAEKFKAAEIISDWVSYVQNESYESEEFAIAVRSKGKSLNKCVATILKWSFEHQYDVPNDIVKAAGISAKRVTLGIPGSATVKQIIRQYYLGGGQSEEK